MMAFILFIYAEALQVKVLISFKTVESSISQIVTNDNHCFLANFIIYSSLFATYKLLEYHTKKFMQLNVIEKT